MLNQQALDAYFQMQMQFQMQKQKINHIKEERSFKGTTIEMFDFDFEVALALELFSLQNYL